MATDETHPDTTIDATDNATPAAAPEDLQTKFAELKASATQQYSLKNYNAAAEFYSEAAELQDEINGEMSPDNADLLYQYGRCLYHVAVSKSDVLGGKVAGTEEPKRKKRKVTAGQQQQGGESSSSAAAGAGLIGDALKDGEQKTAEEVVEAVVEEKEGPQKKKEEDVASKPFFQITGDENWTDSEDEDEDGDGEGGEADGDEEEEDDFATAYEILDMARVLLARKVEAAQEQQQASSKDIQQDQVRQLRERLADTHDLQAEISLENERFHDAINDTRDALALKLQLYPQESSLIAEAHFKLSLALEFASVTTTAAEGEAQPEAATAGASSSSSSAAAANPPTQQVDTALRGEAATEMEKAISSCELRVSKEEALLPTLPADKQAEQTRSIADVKDMIADMKQRLIDLRDPAVSVLNGSGGPAGAPDGLGGGPLRGVLGELLGESGEQRAKRIGEATANANDLSGLVKRKGKAKVENGASAAAAAAAAGGASSDKGKRKAVDGEGDGGAKKVKFETGS